MKRSLLFLSMFFLSVASCATESPAGPTGPVIDVDGAADGWGTGETPCDLCLREYYGCKTDLAIEAGGDSICYSELQICMEDSEIETCEALDEPVSACRGCQNTFLDYCMTNLAPVCFTDFLQCTNAQAIDMWCYTSVDCNTCQIIHAACMETSGNGLECLSGFDTCIRSSGLRDGACAPAVDSGSPEELACSECIEGFGFCNSELSDPVACRNEFNLCVSNGLADATCVITCEVCQELQIDCEEGGGGHDYCVGEIFGNCFDAGALSVNNCSPAFD